MEKSINEKSPVVGNIDRNVYGTRLKVWVWPIMEDGEVMGTYGVMIPKLHPVAQAFEHFAGPLGEAFPEGAFLQITDLEKVIKRQGSKKFDIAKVTIGSPLVQGGVCRSLYKNW